MSKRGSLRYQVFKRFDEKKRFGLSKKAEKDRIKQFCKENDIKFRPGLITGVYSTETCDTYKRHSQEFITWLINNHPEAANDLDAIPRILVGEWLLEQMSKGYSASTINTKASAIAKIYGCGINEFGVAMPSCKIEDVTRSRIERQHDKEISYTRNELIINFCKATGLRRCEIVGKKNRVTGRYEKYPLTVEQIVVDENGNVMLVNIIGKGGKVRDVHVLRDLADWVLKVKEDAIALGHNVVFSHITSKIDIHSYRREYARARYKELCDDKISLEGAVKADYRVKDGRRFDKQLLEILSKDMGHNRKSVITNSYFDVNKIKLSAKTLQANTDK
jgi:site-specific recombinase XerD